MSFTDVGLDIRVGISGLLITAGLLKISTEARDAVFRLVEAAGIEVTGSVRGGTKALPFLELLLGAWLLTPFLSLWALLSTAVVLSLFTVVMARALIRAYSGGCACFGIASRRHYPLGLTDLSFNLVLIASVAFSITVELLLAQTPLSLLDLKGMDVLTIIVTTSLLFGVFVISREIEGVRGLLRALRNG
jgi:hypothetical protein